MKWNLLPGHWVFGCIFKFQSYSNARNSGLWIRPLGKILSSICRVLFSGEFSHRLFHLSSETFFDYFLFPHLSYSLVTRTPLSPPLFSLLYGEISHIEILFYSRLYEFYQISLKPFPSNSQKFIELGHPSTFFRWKFHNSNEWSKLLDATQKNKKIFP